MILRFREVGSIILRITPLQLSGRDPGFSQFSCYGVMLYWQLQLDANNISKRNKVNIGITLTVDDCIQKVKEAKLKFFGFHGTLL
jgi:hypothetical protein